MSNALLRGRTLKRQAVKSAKKWREERINYLLAGIQDNTATLEERRELRWKWGL